MIVDERPDEDGRYPPRLDWINRLCLKAEGLISGSEYYVSRRGVPLVIVPYRGHRASICFFGKSRVWRLFDPWQPGGQEQTKMDFPSLPAVIVHLEANQVDPIPQEATRNAAGELVFV